MWGDRRFTGGKGGATSAALPGGPRIELAFAVGGGVEGADAPADTVIVPSYTESARREALSARTVFIDGEGGLAVSDDTTVAATAPRLSAR